MYSTFDLCTSFRRCYQENSKKSIINTFFCFSFLCVVLPFRSKTSLARLARMFHHNNNIELRSSSFPLTNPTNSAPASFRIEHKREISTLSLLSFYNIWVTRASHISTWLVIVVSGIHSAEEDRENKRREKKSELSLISFHSSPNTLTHSYNSVAVNESSLLSRQYKNKSCTVFPLSFHTHTYKNYTN